MGLIQGHMRYQNWPSLTYNSEARNLGYSTLCNTRMVASMPSRYPFLRFCALCAIFSCLGATGQVLATNPARAQASFQISAPANIAPTVATMPHEKCEVSGKPRMTSTHPNTLWDSVDINHYKEMLATSKELQIQFAALKTQMDSRIAKPVNIPAPRQGPNGAWLYPGEYFAAVPDLPIDSRVNADPLYKFRYYMIRDGGAISDLGTVYALTGDEKYAVYAKALLLAYANASRFGPPKSLDYRYAYGITGQLLDDALILDKLARGYDLVYNLSSWTVQERAQVHDELLRPLAAEMLYPGWPEHGAANSFSEALNNRGAIGATSVLLAGYATDDRELIDAALYGTTTNLTRADNPGRKVFPPPKDWTAATADHPGDGLLTVHFAPLAITGGMWVEGSPTYAFFGLTSMIDSGRSGLASWTDLYRYNNCILKYMFDFPILLDYPDLTTLAENDFFRSSLLTGNVPTLYEYGYRRYRDPRYLAIINSPGERAFLHSLNFEFSNPKVKSLRHFDLTTVGSAPPSLLYDLNPYEHSDSISFPNVNFPTVGFGVLRVPASNNYGLHNLTLSYGPSSSHGHPDKLNLDLYAFNDVLMPSPGVQFPYDSPLFKKWFRTTLAHNTLTVDQKNQVYHPPVDDIPDVRADQSVYGPADSAGIQRAWTDSAYPGVTMDRAVFLNGHYLADLFAAFSASPHQYDLAWHIRGNPTSDLRFSSLPFQEPVPDGYNALTNVRQAEPTENSWEVSLALEGHTARLLAAAGPWTKAILGDGGVYVDTTSTAPHARPTASTIIERRADLSSTIFANVLDVSDANYVQTISVEGGIDSGFALLKVKTIRGVDLCFASYRPGHYSKDGFDSDAIQAMIEMNGSDPEMLYLGGGTILGVGNTYIKRNESGLAYVEKGSDGAYILGNPSSTAATVTIRLPALNGTSPFNIDDQGRSIGSATARRIAPDEISVQLEARGRVRFLSKR